MRKSTEVADRELVVRVIYSTSLHKGTFKENCVEWRDASERKTPTLRAQQHIT